MFFDDYARNWDTDKRITRAKIIVEEISNFIEIKEDLSKQGFKKISSKTFFYDEKKIDEEKVKYSLFIMKAQKIT